MRQLIISIFTLTLLFTSIGHGEDPVLTTIITPKGGKSTTSSNKEIVQNFYNAINKNDSKKLDELLAKNYVVQDSNVALDTDYSKYDAFSKKIDVRMKSLHEALPEFQLTIVEMIGEGNKVLSRIQISGIQHGPFLGVEPTGKPVTIKLFSIISIDGGKITHINEIWNELGVMKQIGHIAL